MKKARLNVRKIRVGFYMPGVFAGLIQKVVDDGASPESAMEAIRKLEACMFVQCACAPNGGPPKCALTDNQKRELIELARTGPYRAVYERAETLFKQITLQCAASGQTHVADLTEPA